MYNFFGTLTPEDFHQANGLIYGDARFDNMIYQIADFTNVLSINLTLDKVKVISALEKSATRWNKSVKVAHVTTDPEIKNMVHAYEKEIQKTNWLCRLFENLDDATIWCNE